jgi:hypothetical protein
MKANPEDLTSADTLFREFLKEMKLLVKSERPRLEAFTRDKSPQDDEDLAVFTKRGKVDPKQYVTELSFQQYAAAQAFAILLAENNRLLLELMNRGSKK